MAYKIVKAVRFAGGLTFRTGQEKQLTARLLKEKDPQGVLDRLLQTGSVQETEDTAVDSLIPVKKAPAAPPRGRKKKEKPPEGDEGKKDDDEGEKGDDDK